MRPSAICIGAQKAGTTALYEYLKLHPQVAMPELKELDFFNCDSRYNKGLGAYLAKFPRRGLHTVGKISLDITPGYMGGAERAAARIAAFRPTMKIIVLLRDPVKRAFSAWHMYRRYHRANRNWFLEWVRLCNQSQASGHFQARSAGFGEDFSVDINEEIEAIRAGYPIEMPILALGDYAKHLRYYFDHFSRKQLLVLWSEDFSRETLRELRRIESFLKLKPHHWDTEELNPHFTGDYGNERLSTSAHQLLREYYAPRNEALFQLVGSRAQWT